MAPAYHVWLSEIMLQQTVVTTVIPYFSASFAAGHVSGIWLTLRWMMFLLRGVGVLARRNLHKAAKFVAGNVVASFRRRVMICARFRVLAPATAVAPSVPLPGQRCVVVDGNIERVMAQFFSISTPLPAAKAKLAAIMPPLCRMSSRLISRRR